MPDFDPFAYFVGDQFARNNANYNNLMNYTNQVGQYDPFAQSGGFGNQTAYYAGLGASYGRAVPGEIYGGMTVPGSGGGGGGYNPGMPIYGGGGIGSDAARAPDQPGNNPSPVPYSQPGGFDPYNPMTYAPSAQPNLGGSYGGYASDPGMPIYGGGTYSGGGIGSDMARSPSQPGNYPTQDWGKYFSDLTGNQQPNPYTGGAGYPYYDPGTYGGSGYGQIPGAMPDPNKLLGYDPAAATRSMWGDNSGGTSSYAPTGISDDLRQQGRDQLARAMQPQQQPAWNPYGSSGGWGIGGFGMPGGVTGGGGYYGGKGMMDIGPGASTDIYGNPTRSGDAPVYPSGVPGLPVFQPTS